MPSPQAEFLWQQAVDADARAFKKNKLVLLAIVMTMLAAALVFMFVTMANT